ncbi:cellulose binding domain-containing protein [Larkinella punicea]|uniref:T9SS C-terminal target domain-containing protein n=1 Tax=Larkinella punicea TaxID=2315727 RepID=A0A368JIK3_9BACT|nr:cellulose binding domain-containing protein [Larkinella punicea]RCR67487.1 T9SS C-terminal target domain-containing protein [Larkinella punicea]
MKKVQLRWLWLIILILWGQLTSRAQTFTPTPAVLTQALNANLVRWKADPAPGTEYIDYNVLVTGKAMNYLALAAYHNPTNTTVVNRLLQQIRSAIAGGNEPTCRGSISGWADNSLAQSLTLAKYTPAVWNQLTPAEINKCDWLMRALTVAGNYNQNYYNTPIRCILGEWLYGGKRNAPNIQEGYVGIMITALPYFGGTAAVNQMLSEFNYDTYLATFESLGFTNIVYGWTYAYGNTPEGRAQMKNLMENGGTDKGGGTINSMGVRRPFTFADYYSSPVAEIAYTPLTIYEALTERMFQHITHNRSNSGDAYVLNNRVSPMTGLDGMCAELQFIDASGERSSVRYTYDGWSNSMLTYSTLRALGLWGNTPVHQEIDRRMRVGSIDLLYKYKAGYRGRSNGEFFNQTEFAGTEYGYVFLKDIWLNYLWDRKDMTVFELMAPTLTESFSDVTLGSNFSDGQFTGVQGLVWQYTQARQEGTSGVKPNDTRVIALAANSTGTLRSTLTKPITIVRFKIRNLSGTGTASVTVRLNDQVLRTYTSFGSDETEVVTVAGQTTAIGDQLVISNSGSVELIVDDVELEQVTTPAAPVNLAVSNIQMQELTLTWTDSATTETGFRLERREMPAGSFQDVQSNLPVNTARYTDRTVSAETVYEYRLTAINQAGPSPAILTTAETLPLVAQDSVSLNPVADAYVNAGTLAGTNYGARNFMNVKYAGPNNSTTREAFTRFDLSSVTRRIQRAKLRVNAISVEANTLNPLTLRLDAMQQDDWEETTINWTNSRSFTSLGELHRWDPVSGSNTVDLETELLRDQAGGLLTLKISTLEAPLATLSSKEATASSQRPLLTIYMDHLTAPTNLTLSGNGQPVLTWKDNADNETGFTVQRKAAGASFTDLATVAANVTTFTDLTAQPGITYTYRVYASNERGKSAYSNTIELTTPTLQVLHKDGDNGQLTNNQLKPELQIKNLGSSAVSYQELTVRYWFTSENHASINTFIDWAQLGTSQVKSQYVRLSEPRQGADGYVEYRFESGAGQLTAGGQSGPIQSRIAKQNWTVFNEADDHSYAGNTDYATTSKVTLYQNGVLIWGVEPAAANSLTQVVAESENKNQATNSNTISTYLRLQNTGNVALAYKDLKVRYWFTAEGSQPLNYWIDYAVLGSNTITGQFVKPSPALAGADTYLEFSFAESLGNLEPSSSTGNIQYRIAKHDWSAFNESDDHSYKAAGPLGANSKITVYYKGQLLAGTEPQPGGARRAAVDAEDGTKNWFVYPNPAKDQVVLGGGDPEKAIDVTILGLTGQALQQNRTRFRKPMRVEHLPPGTYLLRVVQDQHVRHLKLLKQ